MNRAASDAWHATVLPSGICGEPLFFAALRISR
jgi:hypothetical protein